MTDPDGIERDGNGRMSAEIERLAELSEFAIAIRALQASPSPSREAVLEAAWKVVNEWNAGNDHLRSFEKDIGNLERALKSPEPEPSNAPQEVRYDHLGIGHIAAPAMRFRSKPSCGCLRCLRSRREEVCHMVVCQVCGNKRCPHSDSHANRCTHSNEPGQKGSRYE